MAGKLHQDRELASKVRSMVLEEIKYIFELKKPTSFELDLKKQLILKMSTSILPRLNEVSGPDGGEIPLPIYGSKSKVDES